MGLNNVTPVLLTLNEEANIGRALESLRGFARVVVVDSESTDRTAEIARSFGNVAWFVNGWRGFREQWGFALKRTDIETEFVLALDADMSVSKELASELADVTSRTDVDGGVTAFDYRIRGVSLVRALYPPQLRLLRLSKARIGESGHAHLLEVAGNAVRLSARLVHDDWKPLDAFVKAQVGYSAAELARLTNADGVSLPLKSKMRRSFPFTPLLVWLLAWVKAGGPFKGPAARRYALERLIYESMLRWRVEDAKLTGSAGRGARSRGQSEARR